jgi:NAD(P)-dependent dehydrogenase (short-subunit alcohol dehydrogenase family)
LLQVLLARVWARFGRARGLSAMAPKPTLSRLKRVLRAAAWSGVVASFPIWAAAFLVAPFLSLAGEQRVAIAALLIFLADVVFWAGALYLGSDVIARFRPPKVRTGKSFAGRRVVVIGATGRLGEAVARAVKREGGTPLLLARDEARVRALAAAMELDDSQAAAVDVVAPDALRAAAAALRGVGTIDHVVCATGMEACKPLADHSDAEVLRSVEVDLLGPIHVARAFLPVVDERGIVALFGGFADGGVALPYYSVDVAARAGLAGFCAATNRELELEGLGPRLCYVCPAPVDSEPQRPYVASWRKLGTRPVPPAKVADFVLGVLLARRTTAIMGWTAWLLAWLQGTFPWLGHVIVMRAMGQVVRAREPSDAERK